MKCHVGVYWRRPFAELSELRPRSKISIPPSSLSRCKPNLQGMSLFDEAVRDECGALNAIYGDDTVELSTTSGGTTTAVLRLPDLPFSFLLSFPADYPDAPPAIRGTHSTGSSGKGEGDRAAAILVEALGQVYNPGAVCLFDLVEAAAPRLQEHNHGQAQDRAEDTANRSDITMLNGSAEAPLTSDPVSSAPPPPWVLSESLVVNKSTFVARALQVSSMTDVSDAVSYLVSTNKKVAAATHNIKAWRIKNPDGGSGLVQDYDDDGETAAGGRLLHLMQLMDVSNVLVVVTRWYGGVKLGPDRFRVINNVAREALSNVGFVKEEKGKTKKDKK